MTKEKEKGIFTEIKRILDNNEPMIYFILWTYAPDQLNDYKNLKTFEDLKSRYYCMRDRTEDGCRKALDNEKAQRAVRYLFKRLDFKRDTALLNRYYELAMSGDVQALKAYMEFKKRYFSDAEVDELKQIISGAKIKDDSDDEDDFTMDLG